MVDTLIALDDVKKHLRVDYADDDALITGYLAASEDVIANYLDRNLYAEGAAVPDGDADGIVMPPAVRSAIYLLTGHLFENRESVVIGKTAIDLPMAVRFLLAPYRVWRLMPCDAVGSA
jgi:uncharacterized phage protein (predicted DNA packaging)